MITIPNRGAARSPKTLVALLFVFGLVLAACSSGPSTPKATQKNSHGTTTTTAPATPTTVAGAAPSACEGSMLKGSEAAFAAAGPHGQAASAVVVLTNTSKIACTLSGYPKLQLLDAKGNDLTTKVQPGGSGIPTSLTVQTANLAASGGQGSFMLYWVPTPSSSEPDCPLAPKMTVSVPGSTEAVSMGAEINACGGVIQSSPFEPGVIALP